MNAKGAELFMTDTGTEVSVRTSRDVSTGALMIEPLYASDIEVLEGATGELHAQGGTLRGTLRRNGGAFVLASEPAPDPVRVRAPRAKRQPRPLADPVVPAAAEPDPVPSPPAAEAAMPAAPPVPDAATTPDAEVLSAAVTVSRFVRGERDVPVKAARQAHAVIGRFIADQERQARARK